MDITLPEVLGLAAVLVVPSAIGYLLARHCSRAWLALVLAFSWLPLLLLVVPPTARATVFASILLSCLPIIAAFAVGRARRPLNRNQ